LEREDQLKKEIESSHTGMKEFITKNGLAIGMVVLVCYIILLAIGVVAELFNIQWILNWWIWSPPGKFK